MPAHARAQTAKNTSDPKTVQTSTKDNETQKNGDSLTSSQMMSGASGIPRGLIGLQRTIGNQLLRRARGGKRELAPNPSLEEDQELEALTKRSPEEERKEQLAALRDAEAPYIARQLFTGLIRQATDQTNAFLSKDKSAQALRNSIKAKAIRDVHTNIDQIEGLDDAVRTDAKKYAEANVDHAGIVSSMLGSFAKETVESAIPQGLIETKLENRAKEGFNKVEPQPKLSFEKQSGAARASAIKEAEAASAEIAEQSLAKMKTRMTLRIKNDPSFLDDRVDVGDLGESEAEKRQQLDAILADDRMVQSIYTDKLFVPLKNAVLMKLGVGRRAWRRSKELNKFRDELKSSAREQANTEIDSAVETHKDTSDKSTVGKKYFGMLARSKAYKLAKESVNTVMDNEAEAIVKRVLPGEETQKRLKEAAQSAAYDVARLNENDTKKIRAAARSGAKKMAITIYKEMQSIAVNEARKITKGDREKPKQGADKAKQAELTTGVKQQVTQDDVANKSIQMAIKADNINSGLAKISKVIDVVVPNPGDSASFEFELKIPVHESGAAYVMFGFSAEAEKESDEVTVSADITLGAGFQVYVLDANLSAGFFVECSSNNAVGIANLLSYGMYRHMRNISTKAADRLWGRGGKSGMKEVEEAELWAAMVEQEHMQEGHIDVGFITKANVEADLGVAEAGLSVNTKTLSRFDKETVERRNKDGFGDATDITKLAEKAKNLGMGSYRGVFEAGGEVGFNLFGHDISLEGELALAAINFWPREAELTFTGSIPFLFGDMAKWLSIVENIIPPIIGFAKNLWNIVGNQVKKSNGRLRAGAGSTSDIAADALFTLPQFEEFGSSLASMFKGDEAVRESVQNLLTNQLDELMMASQLDLTIGLELGWEDRKVVPNEFNAFIEFSHKKQLEVDLQFLKIAMEKSKRLGKLEFGRDENGKLALAGELFGTKIDLITFKKGKDDQGGP